MLASESIFRILHLWNKLDFNIYYRTRILKIFAASINGNTVEPEVFQYLNQI